MNRRTISSQFRQWLSGEIEAWQSGGILTAVQSGKILDLYESSDEIADRRRSWAMYALCGIAAFLIGLAVLLIVGHNWDGMSAVQKLATLFSALVALYATGFVLRLRDLRLGSQVIFFIACMLYGSSIWLIAQIFNIQSHYPDGVWFWAVGTLPFALALDTLLLHALYAGLLAVWVGCEVLGFQGLNPWLFHGFFVPRAAWTLPLLALPGIWWAYRNRSVAAVGIYAPLLAWWAVLQPAAWQWDVNPCFFIGLAGALFLMIAEMHREEDAMAKPYRIYGVLITAGVLIPMSFGAFIDSMLDDGSAWENYTAGLTVALIGAVAALAVVLFQQRSSRTGCQPVQNTTGCQPVQNTTGCQPVQNPAGNQLQQNGTGYQPVLQRQWFPLAITLLMAGLYFWAGIFNQYDPDYLSRGRIDPWTVQILVPLAAVNLTMIVMAFWLMRVGLREDRTLPFAAGVLYFLLWSILRYADLFAGVGGMLGAAMMFLLCGVGLLAVARFWLHRKDTKNA